jgi:hypothetical protein
MIIAVIGITAPGSTNTSQGASTGAVVGGLVGGWEGMATGALIGGGVGIMADSAEDKKIENYTSNTCKSWFSNRQNHSMYDCRNPGKGKSCFIHHTRFAKLV